MKILKYLAQSLAALIYTSLYTGIMYLVIVLPFVRIVTLSKWKMIIAILVFGGIIEGIVISLQALGIMPFKWIVKTNRLALGISMMLCVLLPLYNIYNLWQICVGYSTWGVVTAIILSGMMLQFVIGSLTGILSCYKETEI